MFTLFVNLYYSMFTGSWTNQTLSYWYNWVSSSMNSIGKLITSIFGDTPYSTFGNDLFSNSNNYLGLISFILATITSIGIVVMAVKGIKRVFGVFFMGIRNI